VGPKKESHIRPDLHPLRVDARLIGEDAEELLGHCRGPVKEVIAGRMKRGSWLYLRLYERKSQSPYCCWFYEAGRLSEHGGEDAVGWGESFRRGA